jgi:hypothetical protein
MPIFPVPLGLDGPQLDVGVSVPKTYAPWGGPPGTWKALIDTGAVMTAISPGVVAALQSHRGSGFSPYGEREECPPCNIPTISASGLVATRREGGGFASRRLRLNRQPLTSTS